jgi:hypothetical protein
MLWQPSQYATPPAWNANAVPVRPRVKTPANAAITGTTTRSVFVISIHLIVI